MAGEKLLQLMQSAGKPSLSELADLVYGEVIALEPLQIKVDNRFTLDENFLILSVMCQEVSWWRGLIVGDVVRMLRVGQGQVFYVIERQEGLTV